MGNCLRGKEQLHRICRWYKTSENLRRRCGEIGIRRLAILLTTGLLATGLILPRGLLYSGIRSRCAGIQLRLECGRERFCILVLYRVRLCISSGLRVGIGALDPEDIDAGTC